MTEFKTPYDAHYTAALDLLSQTGSVDDVYRFIDSIADEDYRDVTLGKIACVIAPEGKLSDALRFCAAITDPLERADSLFRAGVELKKHDKIDSAKGFFLKTIESAEAIGRPDDRAMILLQVAEEIGRLGERDSALEVLHQAIKFAKPGPQPFEAGKTLRGCARLLARWNRLSEAIEVAETIELAHLRATTLEEIYGRGQWPVIPEVEVQ